MATPSFERTSGPDAAAIAAKATQASLTSTLMQLRETPVRQRPVLERDFIESETVSPFGRHGESRRDRRADRMLKQQDRPDIMPDSQVIEITGRSPSGRRFRVRFVPKEIEPAPVARRA